MNRARPRLDHAGVKTRQLSRSPNDLDKSAEKNLTIPKIRISLGDMKTSIE